MEYFENYINAGCVLKFEFEVGHQIEAFSKRIK